MPDGKSLPSWQGSIADGDDWRVAYPYAARRAGLATN